MVVNFVRFSFRARVVAKTGPLRLCRLHFLNHTNLINAKNGQNSLSPRLETSSILPRQISVEIIAFGCLDNLLVGHASYEKWNSFVPLWNRYVNQYIL